MHPLKLQGPHITLRPYQQGDEISLNKNTLSKTPNLEETTAWLKPLLDEQTQTQSPINFAITVDDQAVGHIGGHFDNKQTFTVWYWLGKAHQGKGITTEALQLYTQYLFKTFTELNTIQAETTKENVASKRVLEKCGFAFEKVLEKKELVQGVPKDKLLFKILRKEP